MSDLPPIVNAAEDRAERCGFGMSCEPGVGRMLAVLAAAVPSGGRICELGTGVGVGTSWIVHGLGARTDVRVVTVELDDRLAEIARGAGFPDHVEVRTADAREFISTETGFDVIFADAPGGKWTGLDRTIAALSPGGVLLVDDMAVYPDSEWSPERREKIGEIRATLVEHPDLVTCELSEASGMILAARRRR